MKTSLLTQLIALIVAIAVASATPLKHNKSNNSFEEDSVAATPLKHNTINNFFVEDKSLDTVAYNVTYYKDLTLNVYYNKSKINLFKPKPVVIFYFGGAWNSGNKEINAPYGELLSKSGYVTVIPDFSVYPQSTSLEPMVDEIHKSIEWVNKNIYKYGGDNTKMSISGSSSGAHLYLLTLMKTHLKLKNNGKYLKPLPIFKNALFLSGTYEFGDVQAKVDLYGSFPGGTLYANTFKDLFLNKTNYSPELILRNYKKKSIKTLGAESYTFIESTEDRMVPLGHADPIMNEIKRTSKKHVHIEHVVVEGQHGVVTNGIRDGNEEIRNLFVNLIKKFNKTRK